MRRRVSICLMRGFVNSLVSLLQEASLEDQGASVHAAFDHLRVVHQVNLANHRAALEITRSAFDFEIFDHRDGIAFLKRSAVTVLYSAGFRPARCLKGAQDLLHPLTGLVLFRKPTVGHGAQFIQRQVRKIDPRFELCRYTITAVSRCGSGETASGLVVLLLITFGNVRRKERGKFGCLGERHGVFLPRIRLRRDGDLHAFRPAVFGGKARLGHACVGDDRRAEYSVRPCCDKVRARLRGPGVH